MEILISGAGIAGPTLAYWLARHGHRPTVVERAAGLRSSGSPVDVRGPALEVVRRMGALDTCRDAATGVTGLDFVDARGVRVGGLGLGGKNRQEVELPRGDLATILYEAGRDSAEYLFGDSIATLRQDEHGVDVTFERTEPRRFDLVIGADGLHSTVRRLAFGPEARFVRHMGLYVATVPLGDDAVCRGRTVVMHNEPGRAVALHPSRGGALAAFIFHAPALPDLDHTDVERHRRLLAEAYAGGGWRVPELVRRAVADDDLYFDSVSRVRLGRWQTGRVGLLGDAASGVSLFGDGSSTAVAGAFILAEELNAGDHQAAFRRYESRHRRLTDLRQRAAPFGASLLIPKTRLGITARNLATRIRLPSRNQ
jgi:2-polyprenyl-6-methoxyphenol hydroxylase-like FAD-dependent oxidoreductase